MNTDNQAVEKRIPRELGDIDRWILSRLNSIILEVTNNLDKFELGIAAQNIYDFVWDEFCDWYIEFSKIEGKKEVLLFVVDSILKLLHPFMPFVTEEIWKSFQETDGSIMVERYPGFNDKYINKIAEYNINVLMSVIKSIRNIRSEMNVSHGKKTVIYIDSDNSETCKVLKKYENIICKMAYAKSVEINSDRGNEKLVSAVNDYVKIYIPVDELVDREAEIARLKKELENVNKQLIQAESRLKNEKFLSKAPKEIVDGARESANKLADKSKRILEEISKLK